MNWTWSTRTKQLALAALLALGAFLIAFAVENGGADPNSEPTTATPTTGDTTPTSGTEATTTTTTTEPTTTTTAPPAALTWGDPDHPTAANTDYPTDATTGPEAIGLDEDNLPACPGAPASGTWTITAPGTTIRACEFDNPIRVQAANVTLAGMVIRTNAALIVDNRSTGLTIDASVLEPLHPGVPYGNATTGESCSAGVAQGNYTLKASEVSGCADGVKVANTTEIINSYVHGQPKTSGPSGNTHNDSWQKNDNTPLVKLTITGSAFYGFPCTSNRHGQMKNTSGAEVHITGNFFYGLHGIVNDDGTGSAVTGEITDNVLAGTATAGPFTPVVGDVFTLGSHWNGVATGGNHFDNGAPLPASGDLAADYTCDVLAA